MMLAEARLPDFLIDLHDQYGAAFPRPQGLAVFFNIIHENTTYKKAKNEIDALLALHGLVASSMTITPGPEMPAKMNRSIKFSIAKDLLM